MTPSFPQHPKSQGERLRRPFDLSVYLVVSQDLVPRGDLELLVREAVEGGVTVVQLREKTAPTRQLVQAVRRLRPWLQARGVPLLVNDRVDVALAAAADGVHLGQDDLSPEDARRLLGPHALIGLSAETPQQAAAADPTLIDYVAASGVFPTTTKPELTHPLGLEGLRRLRAASSLPVVAIGGIAVENTAAVIAAGADGIAVVSAICAAADPRAASTALAQVVQQARKEIPCIPKP
jgi:thiamine-phosphate pyrophosphorylase